MVGLSSPRPTLFKLPNSSELRTPNSGSSVNFFCFVFGCCCCCCCWFVVFESLCSVVVAVAVAVAAVVATVATVGAAVVAAVGAAVVATVVSVADVAVAGFQEALTGAKLCFPWDEALGGEDEYRLSVAVTELEVAAAAELAEGAGAVAELAVGAGSGAELDAGAVVAPGTANEDSEEEEEDEDDG